MERRSAHFLSFFFFFLIEAGVKSTKLNELGEVVLPDSTGKKV